MSNTFDFSGMSEMPAAPKAAFEEVTPETARMFLQLNRNNRTIGDRHVGELARTIRAENLMINGESIKLSWPVDQGNGVFLPRLLDGQHRLEAVVEANKPITILVVRGLDPKSQATMDTGRKRTSADWLRILGEENNTAFGAMLSGVWKWNGGDRMFLTSPKPTPIEVEQLLTAHPELRRSMEVGSQASRGFPDLKRTSLGIAHYLVNEIDPEHAPYFFLLIETGLNLMVGHPVKALRDRAASYRRGGEPMLIRREVGLIVRAWNACARDEKVGRIVQPVNVAVPELERPVSAYLPLLENAEFISRDENENE